MIFAQVTPYVVASAVRPSFSAYFQAGLFQSIAPSQGEATSSAFVGVLSALLANQRGTVYFEEPRGWNKGHRHCLLLCSRCTVVVLRSNGGHFRWTIVRSKTDAHHFFPPASPKSERRTGLGGA